MEIAEKPVPVICDHRSVSCPTSCVHKELHVCHVKPSISSINPARHFCSCVEPSVEGDNNEEE